MEAFSDGVLAIVITIMVLELKAPAKATLEALSHEWPVFASYLFSFIYLGIYWNNHHHLLQVTEKVNGKILWANLHLLFWLSLVPFTTSWLGQNHLAQAPVALYGVNLLLSAIAYYILQRTIIISHDPDFILRKGIGKDLKGKASIILYILGIVLAFKNTWLGLSLYILVAMIWIVPDRRIEKHVS